MNIFITLDYELFFGEQTGSVDRCMIKPTEALLKIVDPYKIKITLFVDSGYLLALEKQKNIFPKLKEDYEKVVKQLKYLSKNGHRIELHIHPHWEDSFYNGEKWVFNTKRYKLSDFSELEILDIVTRYTKVLKKITGNPPIVFRAGGWSAQPFEPIQKALIANNIFIDSTVFPKGSHVSCHQFYDFKKVPKFVTKYQFSNEFTDINKEGYFTEIPISSYKVKPWFFWVFALKKIFKTKKHLAYGNGSAIKMPKKEMFRLLLTPSYSVVSIDGFKASLINNAFKLYKKHTSINDNFVLIGHPKAFTEYSLQKTKFFIEQTHNNHNFVTYTLQK